MLSPSLRRFSVEAWQFQISFTRHLHSAISGKSRGTDPTDAVSDNPTRGVPKINAKFS
jgi:hypothetical protein